MALRSFCSSAIHFSQCISSGVHGLRMKKCTRNLSQPFRRGIRNGNARSIGRYCKFSVGQDLFWIPISVHLEASANHVIEIFTRRAKRSLELWLMHSRLHRPLGTLSLLPIMVELMFFSCLPSTAFSSFASTASLRGSCTLSLREDAR